MKGKIAAAESSASLNAGEAGGAHVAQAAATSAPRAPSCSRLSVLPECLRGNRGRTSETDTWGCRPDRSLGAWPVALGVRGLSAAGRVCPAGEEEAAGRGGRSGEPRGAAEGGARGGGLGAGLPARILPREAKQFFKFGEFIILCIGFNVFLYPIQKNCQGKI